MASGSGSVTADYQTLKTERVHPPTGTYPNSRPPCNGDAPTGDPAVDFMIRSGYPLVEPVSEKESNSAFYYSLTYPEQKTSDKIYHDLKRNFRDDTKKNPGTPFVARPPHAPPAPVHHRPLCARSRNFDR
jgi:hypothetical protein